MCRVLACLQVMAWLRKVLHPAGHAESGHPAGGPGPAEDAPQAPGARRHGCVASWPALRSDRRPRDVTALVAPRAAFCAAKAGMRLVVAPLLGQSRVKDFGLFAVQLVGDVGAAAGAAAAAGEHVDTRGCWRFGSCGRRRLAAGSGEAAALVQQQQLSGGPMVFEQYSIALRHVQTAAAHSWRP